MKELLAKIKEALISALPITAIVYLMSLTPWFDFSKHELISFTIGAVLLIVGIGFFNLGADLAMTPMGTHVGSGLSRQKRLGLLLGVCFALGVLITVAEPDLQVLAKQVAGVMNGTVLIVAVGVGVGSTPLDRMTGRKKIARQSVLPLKSWFRITAITKLSTRVAMVLTAIRPISSVRRVLK